MSDKYCKYCTEKLEICTDEGLRCIICKEYIHVRCLKCKVIPNSLNGDVFFLFKCEECSPTNTEYFKREKMSWLKVVVLVLHHLQVESPGLSKKGYYHWKNHVLACIEKYWSILFPNYIKKRRGLFGTVAGTLSHFNNLIFTSGTSIVNEQAWWALCYPKLTPFAIGEIYTDFSNEKLQAKMTKASIDVKELFTNSLHKCIPDEHLRISLLQYVQEEQNIKVEDEVNDSTNENPYYDVLCDRKRVHLFPPLGSISKKLPKLDLNFYSNISNQSSLRLPENNLFEISNQNKSQEKEHPRKITKQLVNPMCYYNTCLNTTIERKSISMNLRIMGGVRRSIIISPYSGVRLKPYIRRDTETFPKWLQLMTEIQLKSVNKNPDFSVATRFPIDYTYVQPDHIPAINSLCNNFFWTGIDLTESLQYPDFSCVVLYKKLIVGFAFVVPNVSFTENYLAFIFTRPGWRNCGIATFMLYHLIQTSLGKDLTVHVSVDNPALLLYQKFGFKVESVALNFYDKYMRSDAKGTKHAFFCRLDR